MCDRFTFQIPSAILAQMFGLKEHPSVLPRYNIAPTQQVPVIRQYADGQNHLDFLHWGLIPPWIINRSLGKRMINARAETLMEKPAYSQAVQYRRCLILASGYYDWELVGKKRQPVYVLLKGGSPMVFAGLWESWKSSEGEVVDSCTILTTNSGQPTPKSRWSLIEPRQHRMPVILHPDEQIPWLDRNMTDPTHLVHLYQPYPADLIERWPVSPLVNNPKNDSADLIVPVEQAATTLDLDANLCML